MRPSRMLTIGILTTTATLAAAITGAAIPARAATPVNYVALGDSYSSGVGTGTESGSCGQSSQAYPALWASANSAASFVPGMLGRDGPRRHRQPAVDASFLNHPGQLHDRRQ